MLRQSTAATSVAQVAVEPTVVSVEPTVVAGEPTVKEEVKAETPKAVESVPVTAVEKDAETGVAAEVNVEKTAPVENAEKSKKKPPRDAIITADRTDYDRKEGVVLFDRNVYVNDEQYQMHSDRLFLFLDGTNDLKRLVAIGNVAITNENKRAYCARATFNKKLGRIVMYSSDEITAELREEGKKGSDVKGEKITFWLDSEQVEVENPVITMPGGFGGKGELKNMLGK
jgi:lipopolysaccharide transport protein LptA